MSQENLVLTAYRILKKSSVHLAILGLLQLGCWFYLAPVAMAQSSSPAEGQACELGQVRWNRDLEAAKRESKKTTRPIFLLFPGGAGMRNLPGIRQPAVVTATVG